MITTEPLVISISEAQMMLGVSRCTIWRAIKRGELRATNIGSRCLILRSSITELLNRIYSPLSHPRKSTLTSDNRFDSLTVRAKNCLLNENIITPEAVSKLTKKELLKIPNCGKVSVNNIIQWLDSFGLRLADEGVCPYCKNLSCPCSRIKSQFG